MIRFTSCCRSVVVLTVLLMSLGVRAFSGGAQEYAIGPFDVLKITVWGHDNLSSEYPVDADGLVAFPLLGRVPAAGLTTNQFASRLTDLLEKDYLVNPQVLVSVTQYLSQ